jgi:hypothetical protein
VRRIAGLIHRMNNGVESKRFLGTIENFSLELFHKKIAFNPRGLFEINFHNLVTVRVFLCLVGVEMFGFVEGVWVGGVGKL